MASPQHNSGAPKALSDKSTFIAFLLCLIGFGGFILWAIFAQLAEGVVAQGFVVVEDNRKVVQHLEGGIIRELHVREGDLVKAGDVLVELDQVASLAQRDQTAQELGSQLAIISRAEAVLDELDQPDFSALDDLPLTNEKRDEIISRQQRLFEQQRDNYNAETAVLKARISTQQTRARDRGSQIAAVNRALDAMQEELNLRLTMLQEQHETIYTIQNLQRQLASLEAEKASLVADRNQATTTATEIQQQLRQVRTQLAESLSAEIAEARRRALAAEEQLNATEDVLERTTITAPQSGKVLNMAFSTVGGVVRSGEPIMEIVPTESQVIAELRIKPTDRDAVAVGQNVRAQLSAYKRWRAEQVAGEVVDISGDLKTVQETGETYYSARVALDGEAIAAFDNVNVIPGMPVEAFIDSGTRRSLLDYLMEPLSQTVKKGTQGT